MIDDGEGIDPADLPLIFQRYATSKISRLEDLVTINSLGFRGEALPSIAAVSRVTLTSRRRGKSSGRTLRLEGGKAAGRLREVGAPEGTAVRVEDLFYNTPARLKFLKSPPVESGRISSLLWELALAHPRVSFTLQSNGRNLLQTAGDGSITHILGSLHGLECAKALLELDERTVGGPVKIFGSISAPYYHRPTRRGITIIVNGRVVRAPSLVYALERGYGNLLPRGRYPVAAIRITMPPNMLDINVHPSKSTVRFQNPGVLSDLVYRAVRGVLEGKLPLPSFKESGAKTGTPTPLPDSEGSRREAASVKDIYRRQDRQEIGPLAAEGKPVIVEDLKEEIGEEGHQESLFLQGREPEKGEMHLIGQFLHSYLVAQRGEELILIDQHAAHERVLYHRLLTDPVGRQSTAMQLTLPLELEIPAPYRERFAGLLDTLRGLGFKLEAFGDNNYIIRALPLLLKGTMGQADLDNLMEELLAEEPEPGLNKREQVCRNIACQQAIKARQALTRREMERLLDEWLATPGYQYCPHGRPCLVGFQRKALDKLFRRQGGN